MSAPAQRRPAGSRGQPGSLAALRKQLAAAKALQAARAAAGAAAAESGIKPPTEPVSEAGNTTAVPDAQTDAPGMPRTHDADVTHVGSRLLGCFKGRPQASGGWSFFWMVLLCPGQLENLQLVGFTNAAPGLLSSSLALCRHLTTYTSTVTGHLQQA